ncbi:PREDICTED: NADH dehydrogenase [ubiquinone] 1 beta subcomplex subunit 8, mitochondrial [Dinoponera quadriceps]|uniref:NADH dehydrogenase [ubiquinone] 1 beta subcomplex subunit 8, mitochondrial n=1 Tax=Dinoponera quadriceps TaxID=609295 RepID=A0A6P3XJ41_DINQU|nr:PREDICTED: NADH dehydrogenase [ubiquinone] 1 beta subcomplex subunit 8, mitochondrial [Dinoponera quadriceps]
MALAMNLGRLSNQSLLRNKGYLYNAVRCGSDDTPPPWNYLWQPGKYSKKDHDKIAEKYHLHPKEYKPLPESACMGDYPDLPMIGPGAKDPYYPYDLPVYKKNYHETLHHKFDIMTEMHYDFGYKHRFEPHIGALICITFMAAFALVFYIGHKYPTFVPVMEKQYPYKGQVHYTFEPADEK